MKDKDKFLTDLAYSAGPVSQVAHWLADVGYKVAIPIEPLRPGSGPDPEYRDSGDIQIIQYVEVKYRRRDFTCVDDYPFRTIFVDEVHKVKERIRNVWAYVIVNRARTHVALLQSKHFDQWVTEEGFDEDQERYCLWYACPKDKDLAWFGRIRPDGNGHQLGLIFDHAY